MMAVAQRKAARARQKAQAQRPSMVARRCPYSTSSVMARMANAPALIAASTLALPKANAQSSAATAA